MSRPLLPPRGVFVPTSVAYNRAMPATILQTWVQLRGLAWGSTETPSISMKQLAEITGKSQSSLYGHMTTLKLWGALRWRPSGTGTFIVSFEAEPDPASASSPGGVVQDSRNLEESDPSHPPFNSSFVYEKEEDREGKFQESGIPESRAMRSRSPGRGQGKSGRAYPRNPASDRFHAETGIHPNKAQSALLAEQVTDLELWEATLKHWLYHGWKPKNIAGQLELYRRGGPIACQFCQKEHNSPNQTLDVLDQLRKELTHGR